MFRVSIRYYILAHSTEFDYGIGMFWLPGGIQEMETRSDDMHFLEVEVFSVVMIHSEIIVHHVVVIPQLTDSRIADRVEVSFAFEIQGLPGKCCSLYLMILNLYVLSSSQVH